MNTGARCLICLTCALFLAALAFAQDQPPTPPASPAPPEAKPDPGAVAKESDVQELIQEILAARLSKQLGLNDEQTVLLLRRFGEYREQLRAFRKERQDILKDLRAGVRDQKPDAEIETKLNALLQHDAQESQLKQQMFEKAAAGLSVSQKAKLYVFLNEFESEMRKLVQRARERTGQRVGRFPGSEGVPARPLGGLIRHGVEGRRDTPPAPAAPPQP